MLRRPRAVLALCATLTLLGSVPAVAHGGSRPPGPPRSADDPGSRPWVQVPRDRLAKECGLDPALMDRADLQLLNTPYAVVRYGKLCWVGGYPGGASQQYRVFSITKTFGAILVGIAASRSSLDDTDRVTEWLSRDELGGINPRATIAHVLAMTSTKPDLRLAMKGAWSYDTTGDREIDTLVTVVNKVIAKEPKAFPGVRNAKELAEKELFAPLGMRHSGWPGDEIGGSMTSSVEDMSRMGLLLLRKGRWNGRQILDERYVYRMTHPAFEDTNTGYGYLTQMNAAQGQTYSTGTNDRVCSPYTSWPRYPHAPFFEAPHDFGGTPFGRPKHDIGLFWAAGAGGQKISVHRGLDLVITVRDDAASAQDGTVGTFEGHKHVWSVIRPALVAQDRVFAGDEKAFCAAYQRSAYAPDLLSGWSPAASGR